MNVDGGKHHPELGLVQLGNLIEDEGEERRPALLLRLGRDRQEVEQDLLQDGQELRLGFPESVRVGALEGVELDQDLGAALETFRFLLDQHRQQRRVVGHSVRTLVGQM